MFMLQHQVQRRTSGILNQPHLCQIECRLKIIFQLLTLVSVATATLDVNRIRKDKVWRNPHYCQ